MKSIVLSLLLGLSVLLGTCAAHGYIHESRSHLCHRSVGINKDCGAAINEPQSVEGPKGFPLAGPPNGHIASGNLSVFFPLDEAGVERWALMPISKYVTGESDGKLVLDFPWTLTASHVTATFDYYISQKNFDRTTPLTRDHLVLEPFCVDETARGIRPPDGLYVSRNCTLDAAGYSGQHVILGVWNIGDTLNAFYQVIDVDFGATS